MTPADTADFALLRGLLGLPAAADAAHDMLELELTQVVQRNPALATTYIELGISGAPLDEEHKRRLIDEVVSHTDASPTLKSVLKRAYPTQYLPAGGTGVVAKASTGSPPRIREAEAPNRRRLRGYAFDPQLSTEFATAAINLTTYSVPWEAQLEPGPCGEYVDVVDVDPASGGFYQPVNLDQPCLLAQDGLAPSEGNPQFHQQMVYAVAMRTIENFELALGRRVQWSARMQGADDERLRAAIAHLPTRLPSDAMPTMTHRARRCCLATFRLETMTPDALTPAARCSPAFRMTSWRMKPPTPFWTAYTADCWMRAIPTCSRSMRRLLT